MEKTFVWTDPNGGGDYTVSYQEDLSGDVKITYPNGMPVTVPGMLLKLFVVKAASVPLYTTMQQATPEIIEGLLSSFIR